MKFILPGSIRSKKNSKRIVKAGAFYKLMPSKAYETWEEQARKAVFPQWHRQMPGGIFREPIHVKVTAYYKGQQPDLSGALESIGDCLEGIIWEDDKLIKSWDGSRLIHDLKNPRTEVEVQPLQPRGVG